MSYYYFIIIISQLLSYWSWELSFVDKSILKKWGTPRTKAVWGVELSHKMKKSGLLWHFDRFHHSSISVRLEICRSSLTTHSYSILLLISSPQTAFVRGVPHFLRMDLTNPFTKNELHHERKLFQAWSSVIKWKRVGCYSTLIDFTIRLYHNFHQIGSC